MVRGWRVSERARIEVNILAHEFGSRRIRSSAHRVSRACFHLRETIPNLASRTGDPSPLCGPSEAAP